MIAATVNIAPAQNANSIVIAANSSSGTYSKMLGEIIGVCSTDQFDIRAADGVTGGAPGNLDALVNNKAQAAFLHSDVFFANSMSDPYRNEQTLTSGFVIVRPLEIVNVVAKSPLSLVARVDNLRLFSDAHAAGGQTIHAANLQTIFGIMWDLNQKTAISVDVQNLTRRGGSTTPEQRLLFVHLQTSF